MWERCKYESYNVAIQRSNEKYFGFRGKEKLMRSNFEESTSELSECVHWIVEAELDGRKHTCLTVDTCPELYAKELENMGFIVEEQRNAFDTLSSWI